MLGAIAKPAGGLIDFATDTASAMKEATRGPVGVDAITEIMNVRLPWHWHLSR